MGSPQRSTTLPLPPRAPQGERGAAAPGVAPELLAEHAVEGEHRVVRELDLDSERVAATCDGGRFGNLGQYVTPAGAATLKGMNAQPAAEVQVAYGTIEGNPTPVFIAGFDLGTLRRIGRPPNAYRTDVDTWMT